MKRSRKTTWILMLLLACAVAAHSAETDSSKPSQTASEVKKKKKSKKTRTPSEGKTPAPPKTQTPEVTPSLDEELAKEYETPAGKPERAIADPLRPVNVVFFHVNDKLYFWAFKPVATGYKYVLYPRPIRVGIRNVIRNLGFPGRFFNTALQAKFKGTGVETLRFLTNTTLGVLGVWDPAKKWFELKTYDEDFDQTLGVWGVGMGFYLNLPLIGPTSLRGVGGRLGDMVLNPIQSYSIVRLLNYINTISLGEDDYETLLKAALDPYTALRDAYADNRAKRVKE
ncbi:MAG: VacJ family lipoprotein [Candidatus Sumerlaeia bacterium]|nr:VacJ family lipoprotein [Candidatus Sumerlaeia bacterium]